MCPVNSAVSIHLPQLTYCVNTGNPGRVPLKSALLKYAQEQSRIRRISASELNIIIAGFGFLVELAQGLS